MLRRNICKIILLTILANHSFAQEIEVKPNAGLILPDKFKAELIADNLGRTRHLVITPSNGIYVRLARLKDGVGTLYLEQKDSKATVKAKFGNFGGTGVFLKNGYLYTASNSEIFRYKLNERFEVIAPDNPEKLVTGLVDKGTHETKSIAIDDAGNMYIPIGCPSNSCQEQDRQMGSMGIPDCPLLKNSGGVWMFRSDKLNQTYDDGIRYATGLRNVVGVDWNKQNNQLYVMQHGRDQLNTIFPELYTSKQNAELPAECMFALNKNDDAGWPYIYYDQIQKKKIQAPEYGGDGKKEGSSKYIDPVVAFPGHLAPNALLFYSGDQFPARYKNGAFIAFHGSWNRAPEPQKGYFVVFQPFKDGKPYGDWEIFADNFAGSAEKAAIGRAERRPCGLAQGPDGALYVCDDAKGGIFKISYNEGANVESKKQPESKAIVTNDVKKQSTVVKVPAKTVALKPVVKAGVPNSLAKSIASGKTIYNQSCVTCHMADGGGVQSLNPPLAKTTYVLGSSSRLINVLLKGMSKQAIDGEIYSNVMPSFSYFTDKQIADVLTYVRNSFGNKASAVTAEQVKSARTKKKYE
ncbi:c-type cytochrome [Flavobacterium aquiphilum]|uniref:c-type cytochrome n=1 Tax=Flavobacterium aquiphilum TaxID=3003261 RepID=UPI0024810A90|nr:c-type cytochrome [Flavobacterium aquiphilum]